MGLKASSSQPGGGEDDTSSLKRIWPASVEVPAREAKQAVLPRLTVLKSPFRFVVQRIIDHVLEIERNNLDRSVAVLLPELVKRQWYQYFLHNQGAQIIAAHRRKYRGKERTES